MSRSGVAAVILVAAVAAGTGGFQAGRRGFASPFLPWLQAHGLTSTAGAVAVTTPSGPIIYYRDPDGLPAYSAGPKTTTAGRDFLAVHASEDVSFDTPRPVVSEQAAPGAEAKKIRYYRNPMGLPDTSPVPKKDSMGMDYIAVFEGDDEGASVKMSPGKLQRTGVRSEPASLRMLTTLVRASGTVQLDEQRQSIIALRFDAYIENVEDVTTGSLVKKGQPLLHIYGPDLLAPAAQYVSALNDHSDVATLRSARRRLDNLGVPESVTAAIERARDVPSTIAWPAPRGGIVIERTAVDGMKASAGASLFRLADISVVWVLADIPEGDLPRIAVGQKATIKPRGVSRTFEGRIGVIYPTINKDTRTARLRVELPNPDNLLLPNMYAEVDIATGSAKPVLTIADTALIDSGDRRIVILDKGEGKFEPRPVKTGRQGGGFVEITDGLANGEQVVVAANFLIDAESNLKAALQGLAQGEAK